LQRRLQNGAKESSPSLTTNSVLQIGHLPVLKRRLLVGEFGFRSQNVVRDPGNSETPMPRLIQPTTLRLPSGAVALGERPIVMGILNVTPDSFSDGGEHFDPEAALQHGMKLAEDGADWIDVGGESTRPAAEPVSLEEELRRTIDVVRRLAASLPNNVVSIDTYKPEVANEAVAAGAGIINDVTGFRDPKMIEVAANCSAGCVVMHMRGDPKTMASMAEYDDVVEDLMRYFAERIEVMTKAGIDRERIVLDPGIGFAKNTAHNLDILRRLDRFHEFGRPILLGASRKKIVGELTGRPESQRLAGTLATTFSGFIRGVHAFRVHDVAAVRDALAVASVIESTSAQGGGTRR
jgi:dihydropteroate synthase